MKDFFDFVKSLQIVPHIPDVTIIFEAFGGFLLTSESSLLLSSFISSSFTSSGSSFFSLLLDPEI